jgi:branched-chain amino acid transport system substrate-binding protein
MTRKIWLGALVAAGVVIFAILFWRIRQSPENEVLKIGAILPMTGRLAVMGEVEKNAMLLAQEDFNAGQTGKKIEIIFEDGKGNPAEAVSAARKLLDLDKVDILLTSTTGATLAVQPIATQQKVNLIAFCMDPDVAKSSEYVIRYYEGIENEADAITKYFISRPTENKKVGILYATVPVWEKVVNQIFLPFFASQQIPVAFKESYALNEKDFNTLVVKMKASGIDHLILLGYGFEYQGIFKPLADYQMLDKLQIIGGWGFLYTNLEPKFVEGILVAGPEYVSKSRQLGGSFLEKYFGKYGGHPNFDAAFAYNAITSIATYVSKQDAAQPIKRLYAGKGNLSGVVGEYHFSPDGEMIVKTGIGRFNNGLIVSPGDK